LKLVACKTEITTQLPTLHRSYCTLGYEFTKVLNLVSATAFS